MCVLVMKENGLYSGHCLASQPLWPRQDSGLAFPAGEVEPGPRHCRRVQSYLQVLLHSSILPAVVFGKVTTVTQGQKGRDTTETTLDCQGPDCTKP